MSLKRTIGFIIIFLVLCSVVLIGVLYTFSFVLPKVLESVIISGIETDTGLSGFVFDVRELDLEGADFSNVIIGSDQTPALIIRSIQIDYSLADLYQKKIKNVTASGIELYCEFNNGKFGFRGIDLDELIQRLRSRLAKRAPSSDTTDLFALKSLKIRNATVICEINTKTYRVPFELDILPQNKTLDVLTCEAQIYAKGQKVLVSAHLDLKTKKVYFNCSADPVDLAGFADLAQTIDGLDVSGQANLLATAELSWEPFTIFSIAAFFELHNSRIRFNNFQLQNPVDQKKKSVPLHIKLESTNGTEWKISASTITASSPIPFNLSKFNYNFNLKADAIQGTGKFDIALDSSDVREKSALPFRVAEHIPLRVSSTMRYSKNGNLAFSFKNQISKKEYAKTNKFSFKQFNIATKLPAVEISGNVGKDKGTATYRVKIPDVQFQSEGASIKLPAVSLTGTADINRGDNGTQTGTFKLQLPNSGITLNSTKISMPNVMLSGKFLGDNISKRRLDGLLRWADTSLILPELHAKIIGLQGTIPFEWPVTGKGKQGSFSIKALQYQDIHLGTLTGTIQQTAQGIAFEGEHNSRLFPEFLLKFMGTTKFVDKEAPETKIHFQLSPPDARAEIDLGTFLPIAKGAIISGNVSLDGDVVLGKHGMRGWLNSRLDKGKMQLPEKKISIDGIQMALAIPELPSIRSAPKQQLFFEKAAMGGIAVNNGKIEFQIESLSSLFIEKSQFRWCDGNVDTYAIRISPTIQDYRLILYCDRLNMPKVLEQFGAATAVGQGSVNGRIPLRYYQGKLSFDDGVLYSTPGETGKIRLTDTEILTAGIPPNTPQYIQMELAREALKDYDVSWAKLNITSEGEDLLLRMQLDGKPANPLPFVYKKDLGQFAKIETEGKGSIFQGIRLNVNFRLPLNKMLQYKDLIRRIQ